MDFDCYLEKPVSREEVVETVDELFARTEYAREVQALFSLASKIGFLRSRYPESELREDERFQRLEAELQRVRQQSESMLADVDGEEFAELLQVVTDVDGAEAVDNGDSRLDVAADGGDAEVGDRDGVGDDESTGVGEPFRGGSVSGSDDDSADN